MVVVPRSLGDLATMGGSRSPVILATMSVSRSPVILATMVGSRFFWRTHLAINLAWNGVTPPMEARS